MTGLGTFKTYEDCLDFIQEAPGFNSIVSIDLLGPDDRVHATLFAVDRLQDCVSGFMNELDLDMHVIEDAMPGWSSILVGYRLLPAGKRKEPMHAQFKTSRKEVMQINELGINVLDRAFRALQHETICALVEGR